MWRPAGLPKRNLGRCLFGRAPTQGTCCSGGRPRDTRAEPGSGTPLPPRVSVGAPPQLLPPAEAECAVRPHSNALPLADIGPGVNVAPPDEWRVRVQRPTRLRRREGQHNDNVCRTTSCGVRKTVSRSYRLDPAPLTCRASAAHVPPACRSRTIRMPATHLSVLQNMSPSSTEVGPNLAKSGQTLAKLGLN